ncbi:hypothetical protein GIB67_023564 [Kingdonia uniflora]|uniref:SWIM-type domain-containing protein n=1 Tax=Kingdonia uniflora TaxID=39325 RepID=A0A7J7PA91_9MAGN|nr:hypothetical protein GIB67_023564 [Kingdonia uniflora]
MLTNVPLSIEPEPIIEQTKTLAEFRFEPQPEQVKDLLDFRFKYAAYTEHPYDFSKEFNIGDLYRDKIELKNHIRVYAVVNKFNLEQVLSNEFIIVTRRPPKVGNTSWRCLGLISTVMILDSSPSLAGTPELLLMYPRYGVAYTNHVESWNNVIFKIRDLLIHVFIEELRKICSEMSYTYREESEKSQARITPWVTDHCESRKFVADSLTCRACTSHYHFQTTSYGRNDSVNIEGGTCFCRWWQTMGKLCEHGVHALRLANVDPTIRVSKYFTNDTYKVFYEPIWIPIRRIEQWKILKTDPRVRAPIPTVRASRPRT